MPFTGSVDLQFLDENDIILYELTGQGLFNSPEVGSDGRTIAANESIEEIVLDKTAIDAYLNSSTINIVMSINTFDASNGTAVEMVRLYKKSGEWRLATLGEVVGDTQNGLEAIINKYQ